MTRSATLEAPKSTEGSVGRLPAPGKGVGDLLEGRFRYRLEARLGRGTYGSVFRAVCLSAGALSAPPRLVAVKTFHPPSRPDHDPLRRELSSLLAVETDRIPRVYDWSTHPGAAFVAMEYFAGGSLGDLLAEGPLDEAGCRRLLEDLLVALQVAHRAAILHLDIKPGNVLLDGRGGFVLSDFGISRASHADGDTLTGGFGTPHYRAPEQRTGSAELLDTRTDLWGAGATVWAAATGFEPSDERVRELPHAPGRGLPPIERFRSGLSDELSAILMRLLSLDPADRPGSAAEVLDLLRCRGESRALSLDGPLPRGAGEVRSLLDELVDPLLAAVLRSRARDESFLHLESGERLATEGETAYHAYLLLHGRIRVERGGRHLTTEHREGTFLGEVATLTGQPRTASMVARGPAWVYRFNAAELEELVSRHPALGLRLIHSMAERLVRTP